MNDVPNNSDDVNLTSDPGKKRYTVDPLVSDDLPLIDSSVEQPYRLKVRPIPAYVVERLNHTQVLNSKEFNDSEAQFMKKLQTSNDNPVFSNTEMIYSQGQLNDPFTFSFKDQPYTNKWSNFLHTVQQPVSVYLDDQQNYKKNTQKQSMLMTDHNIKDKVGDVSDNGSISSSVKDIFNSYKLQTQWQGERRLNNIYASSENGTILSDASASLSSNSSSLNSEFDEQKKKSYIAFKQKEQEIKRKAREWLKNNKRNWKLSLITSILSNAYIPLFFRITLIALSSVALALAAHLVKEADSKHWTQQPSPLMAIIVQTVSIAYLLYITYDEFTSQPLGLRNPQAKIRLVLLDLFFIIFSSANLALSFQSLFDSNWVCRKHIQGLCDQQRTLSGILLVTIVLWCTNFTISIYRIVNTVNNVNKRFQG